MHPIPRTYCSTAACDLDWRLNPCMAIDDHSFCAVHPLPPHAPEEPCTLHTEQHRARTAGSASLGLREPQYFSRQPCRRHGIDQAPSGGPSSTTRSTSHGQTTCSAGRCCRVAWGAVQPCEAFASEPLSGSSPRNRPSARFQNPTSKCGFRVTCLPGRPPKLLLQLQSRGQERAGSSSCDAGMNITRAAGLHPA